LFVPHLHIIVFSTVNDGDICCDFFVDVITEAAAARSPYKRRIAILVWAVTDGLCTPPLDAAAMKSTLSVLGFTEFYEFGTPCYPLEPNGPGLSLFDCVEIVRLSQ
jgi:hypothetical protein